MARVRKQGVSALTVWMVIFVGLWLTSTVLLVILYTGQEELKTKNQQLTEANRRLISPQERNAVTVFQQASPQGPTVVGLLEQARASLAELATGEPSDDVEAARGKLEEFLRRVRADKLFDGAVKFRDLSYHDAVTRLYEALSAGKAREKELSDRVAQLESEVDRLTKAAEEQRREFEKRARELSDRLAEAEKDRARYREQRDQEVAQLERDAEERRRQADADLTEERQRTAALQQRVGQLEERAEALREKLGEVVVGPQPNAVARVPDGKVLTAVPGDPVVYIDLGRKDRMVLGMKFGVYSAEDGIPADGRAKAQIRVVTIFENASECEILDVRPGRMILEGDLIANPVYDRDRSVIFAVAGDFDLDHDGRPDPNGADLIRAMITDWGGTVADEVTARADFVVLGGPPRKPGRLTNVPDELRDRMASIQRRYDRYRQTVEAADTLSIPILTQEVFLNFLGYNTRLAGR